MRLKLLIICIISLQCSDLINNSNINFDSIFLDGGSWIQLDNRGALFIDENSLDILENGEFTLEFWLSNETLTSTDSPALFMIGNENNNIELAVFQNINKSNIIRVYINDVISEIEVEGLDWTEKNKFYYISFVFDHPIFEIYIDGEYVAEISIPENQNLEFSGNDIFIGAKGFKDYSIEPSNFWSGYFDEIRIWKKSLSNIFYYSTLRADIDTSTVITELVGIKKFIDGNNDDIAECLLIYSWDNNNNNYQEIDNLHNTGNLTNYNNCVCYDQADGTYDCWNITSLIDYHYSYPDQVIENYGDPLLNELISLLKFNEFPKNNYTVSDDSGNDNDANIFSLSGYKVEFVENGY